MKLEDQVCSLELSKKLKLLNFKQESLFYWFYNPLDKFWEILYKKEIHNGDLPPKVERDDCLSAYTVAELGSHIPDTIEVKHNFLDETLHIQIENNFKRISYRNIELGKTRFSFEEKNEADTRAKLICYLKENNLI